MKKVFIASLLRKTVTVDVECGDPRCTHEGTDLLGRCECLDWTDNPDPPSASTVYISEEEDKGMVINKEVCITHYGIDLWGYPLRSGDYRIVCLTGAFECLS